MFTICLDIFHVLNFFATFCKLNCAPICHKLVLVWYPFGNHSQGLLCIKLWWDFTKSKIPSIDQWKYYAWWYHKQLCIIMPIWQRYIKRYLEHLENFEAVLKISTMKMSGGHFTDIWPRDKISAFHILTFRNILLFHNSDNENLKMVIMIIIKAMMVMIIG